MGQQPNIPLDIEDLPRPVSHPDPARRWRPERPGDITAPSDMPTGPAFGNPAPDAGYALRLVSDLDLALGAHEDRHDVAAALAAVAMARASLFGRAPTAEDVAMARLVFGFDGDGIPAPLLEGLQRDRLHWFANLAHRPGAAADLAGRVPDEVLAGDLEQARRTMAGGDRLIT